MNLLGMKICSVCGHVNQEDVCEECGNRELMRIKYIRSSRDANGVFNEVRLSGD